MVAGEPFRSRITSLFDAVLIPVASRADAEITCETTTSYLLDQDAYVIVVHVIEKRRLAPDTAPLSYRESDAERFLDYMIRNFEAVGITAEAHVRYGTNIAEAILEAAEEFDVSAIAFTPRGTSRWLKLLSEDVASRLVTRSTDPVLVIPDQ